MATKVVVMAQGWATRWHSQEYQLTGIRKQLIPINGEPLVCRTLRQLRALGHNDVVVVSPEDFQSHVDCPTYTQENEIGPLLHGFQHTWALWGTERTLVLLGDVCFSWAALEDLLNPELDVMFSGRTRGNRVTKSPHAELYGFTFDRANQRMLKYHIDWALRQPGCRCHLWTLYRLVIDVDYRKHTFERKLLMRPDDYTDDIDSIEEYSKIIDILNYEAKRDDEKWTNQQVKF